MAPDFGGPDGHEKSFRVSLWRSRTRFARHMFDQYCLFPLWVLVMPLLVRIDYRHVTQQSWVQDRDKGDRTRLAYFDLSVTLVH